jgi:hypothetical protein
MDTKQENNIPEKIELTFTFKEEEVNLILNTLAELPYKVSSGMITKIQLQAQSQLQPKAPKKPEE